MARLRTSMAAALAAAALLGAGCGGDDDEPAATPAPSGAEPDGAQLFTSACGSCHTLAAAGTDGQVGPNLDDVRPDAERVRAAITAGPGAMPENLYEGAEADAVAAYVAENAGQ